MLDAHATPVELLVAGQSAQSTRDRVAGHIDLVVFERECDERVDSLFDEGGGVPVPVHASTSATRLQVSAAVTKTRIFAVVTGAKVNCRHTRLLPVTRPPGTSAHALPVQYCTSKLRSPYSVNVIVGVGGLGA